ncbi:MAG: putative DNA binding domain-containing protein [Acidobacteria bacterium]|nr:putative DNA binding domain-containing protein [Acidobacteriota bacterium]
MNDTQFARRIRLGEDSTLELKEVRFEGRAIRGPRRDVLADELAAFANAGGGTLILGITDARRVVGIALPRLDAVERLVRETCSDSITPPLDADIHKIELAAGPLDGGEPRGAPVPILVVVVPRSLAVHKSPGGYFRRVGSSKRELEPDALARLFEERKAGRRVWYEEFPVPGTRPLDLDEVLARRFVGDEADFDETVRKMRLVTEESDGTERLTVAGALLATPNPQQWLPHAFIQAVLYAGDQRQAELQIDAEDIGGPLDSQALAAFRFVRRNMRIGAVKRFGRVDIPQYSERAVFEALVNAVAHRDYSMAGSHIRLQMFPERFELYVPGGLLNTMTPDSLHLRQVARNHLVVSLLARCAAPQGMRRETLMDRRGLGVPVIIEETRALSGEPPSYELLDESELRLVLPAAKPFGHNL